MQPVLGLARMYVVNNSSRALLVALIPLAVVHAVLTAMALLGTQATQPTDIPAPDQVLVLYVARLATDGALLFAGHWMLRQRAISGLVAYALMGGIMDTLPVRSNTEDCIRKATGHREPVLKRRPDDRLRPVLEVLFAGRIL